MTPADPELVARLEERVKSLDRENAGLRRELDTMTRMMDRNAQSFAQALTDARKEASEKFDDARKEFSDRYDAVIKRVTALELFRSYLKPGIALLAVLGLAMVAQLGAQMWAAATASYRPPQGFPMKAPTNLQEEAPR